MQYKKNYIEKIDTAKLIGIIIGIILGLSMMYGTFSLVNHWGEPKGAFGYEFGDVLDTSTAVYDSTYGGDGNYRYVFTDTISPPIGGVQIIKVYTTPKTRKIYCITATNRIEKDTTHPFVVDSSWSLHKRTGEERNHYRRSSDRRRIKMSNAVSDLEGIINKKYGAWDKPPKNRTAYARYSTNYPKKITRGSVSIDVREIGYDAIVTYKHWLLDKRLLRECKKLKKENHKAFLLTDVGQNF